VVVLFIQFVGKVIAICLKKFIYTIQFIILLIL